uniref:Bm10996 n=1 Tax=Brugia malayi TaxID=6279 RepID=A0A0J9Y367_BRUMA|nr:Bm10996 [Brugia malayi]
MFLTDEKALATKSLVILDVRPEEQIAKEHITKEELLTTTNSKPVKLEASKLAVNRKPAFEKSPLHQTSPFSQL